MTLQWAVVWHIGFFSEFFVTLSKNKWTFGKVTAGFLGEMWRSVFSPLCSWCRMTVFWSNWRSMARPRITGVNRIWKFNSGPVRFLRCPTVVIIIKSLKCMYLAFLEPFSPFIPYAELGRHRDTPHTGASVGETRSHRTWWAPFAPISPRVT